MRQILNALSVLALFVTCLFSLTLITLNGSRAQSGCYGERRCQVWHKTESTYAFQCVYFGCSEASGSATGNAQWCRRSENYFECTVGSSTIRDVSKLKVEIRGQSLTRSQSPACGNGSTEHRRALKSCPER